MHDKIWLTSSLMLYFLLTCKIQVVMMLKAFWNVIEIAPVNDSLFIGLKFKHWLLLLDFTLDYTQYKYKRVLIPEHYLVQLLLLRVLMLVHAIVHNLCLIGLNLCYCHVPFVPLFSLLLIAKNCGHEPQNHLCQW